jgi:hypothetical protein
MAADSALTLRPRTSGEILDDAWLLARAHLAPLLALSSLFLAPAFCALLLLVTQPAADNAGQIFLLPAVTAALLVLSGLGSGACQELLRRQAEDQAISLTRCLHASWRRGLGHCTTRAIALIGIGLGLSCLVMPGLLAWMTAATMHAALAGTRTGSLREVQIGREVRFDALKALAVVLSRVPLLAAVAINLLLLINPIGLWVAGNLAGLDVALIGTQLSWTNQLFLVALALFAWLLLAPYFEASNFLLHLDTRVRQEGLDLQYRVQRLFPVSVARRAVGVLAALGVLAGLASTAVAQPASQVASVRAKLQRIREEVRTADPYTGGGRWADQLNGLANNLERSAPGHDRWFKQAVKSLADNRNRTDALDVLDDLDQRLAVLEESLKQARPAGDHRDPAEVKSLLRPGFEERATPREEKRKEEKPREPKEQKDQPREKERQLVSRRGDGGLVAPVQGGLGSTNWLILAGLLLAVLVAGLVLWLRRRPRVARHQAQTGTQPDQTDAVPAPHEQPPTLLLRQAEELARVGKFNEAVRTLYHAVLSLLHRRQLLRCEPTRTNGEYVSQVCLAPQAPPELHEVFESLTRRFDSLWYGEQGCGPEDFAQCRQQALEIRTVAGD